MKKLLMVLTAAALLSACASSTVEDEAAKRERLQELKQQAHTLETQIDQLEKELASTHKTEVVKIKTSELNTQKFEHFIEVTASVEAAQDVDVSPESSGIIKEVFITEGQRVSKGQLMARLNTDVLQRSVDELEVQLSLATTNYERQKNLWDQNIGSEMEYLQAKNNKESLEKRIESLNTQIELGEIKSPSDGVVDILYQEKGQIGSPQIPFAKVININKLKIYGDVSESYLTKISEGDSVAIRFPALDHNVDARIDQVGNIIDPNNRTFRIRIDLDNPNKMIKPNLVAVLKLKDYANNNAIVVPTLYIKEDFTGHYTYIVENTNGQSVAKKIYVTPGVNNNNLTEVTEGLSAGMQVISEGFNQVSNGTPVEVN